MSFKGNEEFVANSIQAYFKEQFEDVCFEKPKPDPPDIYLNIDDKKIAVEITDIDQNVLKNRKTIDYGYLSFIKKIDKELGHLIHDDKKILLFFYHDYTKVSTISKRFKKYLKSLIETDELEIDNSIENHINDVNFKISILPMPKKGTRKIVGSAIPFGAKVEKSRKINTVLEIISDSNLSEQTLNILNNRIYDKNIKCKDIKKPIWLALFDNYFNKFAYFDNQEHFEHYNNTFESVKSFGIFEKVLVIFENGDVLEFNA